MNQSMMLDKSMARRVLCTCHPLSKFPA